MTDPQTSSDQENMGGGECPQCGSAGVDVGLEGWLKCGNPDCPRGVVIPKEGTDGGE